MKKFELIEHTADIGIRIEDSSLVGIFVSAAEAMFDIIAQKKSKINNSKSKTKHITVKLKGEDREELFINWLNELLSLSSAKGLIFSNFQIKKLAENTLRAIVTGNDIKDYKVNTEIKAATYHELKLQESTSGWQAEVILDV